MTKKIKARLNTFNYYIPLLSELIIRDIKLKYRKSFLGYLWSILSPLMTMSIMLIVFSNIFRFDIEHYAVYLIIGQIVFKAKLDGVESTKYYKETVDKLTKVTNFMSIAAIVIMMFLIIVSIVVVANTIKLTVFARAKEISIMKYIGATNWFVRGPFFVEGVILGIISSGMAAGVTYLLYDRIVDAIGLKVMTVLSTPLVPAAYLASNLIIIFASMGVGIGAVGSIVSMRKFLEK